MNSFCARKCAASRRSRACSCGSSRAKKRWPSSVARQRSSGMGAGCPSLQSRAASRASQWGMSGKTRENAAMETPAGASAARGFKRAGAPQKAAANVPPPHPGAPVFKKVQRAPSAGMRGASAAAGAFFTFRPAPQPSGTHRFGRREFSSFIRSMRS